MSRLLRLRAARDAALQKCKELVNKAEAEGRPDLNEEEDTAYKAGMAEVKTLDAAIAREEELEAAQARSAVPVTLPNSAPQPPAAPVEVRSTPASPAAPAAARSGPVGRTLEQGEGFGQYVRCLAAGRIFQCSPVAYAETRAEIDGAVLRALQSNVAAGAAELVPEQFSAEFIGLLTAAQIFRRMGPRNIQLPAGYGSLKIPRITEGASAGYVGEASPIQYSEMKTGELSWTPKKLGAVTSVTKEMIRRASPSVDRMVRDDLLRAAADTADAQLIRGTGSNIAPKSMKELRKSGNNVTMTSNPDLAKVTTDLDKMTLKLREQNVRMVKPAWGMAPRTATYLMSLRDGNGNFAFREEMLRGTLNRYPWFETTTIPVNLGGSSNASELYFADMDCLTLVDEMSVEVTVSDQAAFVNADNQLVSAFSLDLIVLKVTTSHDLNARYPEGIALMESLTWGAS